VRLALYFQRKAPGIRTGYDILADPALMKVAETVLGYSLAQGDIDKNARMVEEKLHIEDFQDPAKLDRFLARFTTMWEMNGEGGTTSGGTPNALISQPLETGISQDLLQTLQNLKISGV